MGDPSFYPFHPVIEKSFNESDYLVVEINIRDINTSQLIQLTQKFMMYQGEESVKDHLSDELYLSLKTILEEFKQPVLAFLKIKPIFITLSLQQLFVQKMGYTAADGVDLYFLNKAVEQKKEILELESLEYQFSILSKVSKEAQIAFLKSTINDLDSLEKDVQALIKAWQTGDKASFIQLLKIQATVSDAQRNVTCNATRQIIAQSHVSQQDQREGKDQSTTDSRQNQQH
jgi:uncharacterized protein YbaP (TraB family)